MFLKTGSNIFALGTHIWIRWNNVLQI